jgi:hypothetical protein
MRAGHINPETCKSARPRLALRRGHAVSDVGS